MNAFCNNLLSSQKLMARFGFWCCAILGNGRQKWHEVGSRVAALFVQRVHRTYERSSFLEPVCLPQDEILFSVSSTCDYQSKEKSVRKTCPPLTQVAWAFHSPWLHPQIFRSANRCMVEPVVIMLHFHIPSQTVFDWDLGCNCCWADLGMDCNSKFKRFSCLGTNTFVIAKDDRQC